MKKVAFDLHIHSCLSPCADREMTPNNIVNMALACGLELIALTDHNSCANAPAFLQAAKKAGIPAFAGMELSTAEEIHVICLFPMLDFALHFSDYVYSKLPALVNQPHIFGEQWVMDASDGILRQEERFLAGAAKIAIGEVGALVRSFGGICYPAHIDRSSFSILSVLGAVPPECGFTALEVTDAERFFEDERHRVLCEPYTILSSSDAHSLEDIARRERVMALDSTDFASLKKALGGF